MAGVCGLVADESQSWLGHITLRFGASDAPLQTHTQSGIGHRQQYHLGVQHRF